MTSVTNEIFNINNSLRIDESIESLRFVEYEPWNTSAYNESTDITIAISAQDNFVLPCKSYLIEGVLKTAADAVSRPGNGEIHCLCHCELPTRLCKHTFIWCVQS